MTYTKLFECLLTNNLNLGTCSGCLRSRLRSLAPQLVYIMPTKDLSKHQLRMWTFLLCACRTHRSFDLIAVWRQIQLANASISRNLARWRNVLFTDDSPFPRYHADSRHFVSHPVGEHLADVIVVWRVPHGVSLPSDTAAIIQGKIDPNYARRCTALMVVPRTIERGNFALSPSLSLNAVHIHAIPNKKF